MDVHAHMQNKFKNVIRKIWSELNSSETGVVLKITWKWNYKKKSMWRFELESFGSEKNPLVGFCENSD